MEKLFLVDAYALIFRFYYAFISRPMRNPQGENTSAIFGFTKFLNELIAREHPNHLGVAFDPPGGNFRHDLYPLYKANRDATPEDIKNSVPYIKEILHAMRIPILEIPKYEADDVIGTISHKASLAGGYDTYMVTPDKDYGQLIRPNVSIYKPRKSGEGIEIINYRNILDYYCISDPGHIVDILALWGDASDNIPGVPGIGEKGACKLVGQWGTVENIIAHADELPLRQKEAITEGKDQLLLSKKLAHICLDVPIKFEPDKLVMEQPDWTELRRIYLYHGFSMFLREMDSRQFHITKAPQEPFLPMDKKEEEKEAVPKPYSQLTAVQGSLFDVPAGQAPRAAMNARDYASGNQGDSYETIRTVGHSYHTVETDGELDALIGKLSAADAFCFDTETTGLNPLASELVGLSFAVNEHEAYWVPALRGKLGKILAKLQPLFADKKIGKIGQNIKFDMLTLMKHGVRIDGPLYDTMIIHYLLDPESRHAMGFLSRKYLGYDPIPIEDLIGSGGKQLTMDRVAPHLVAEYAAEDADITLQLKNKLWPMLAEEGQQELYHNIEEPLIAVLADMEFTGVKIDPATLSESAGVMKAELDRLENEIREMAGVPDLNVNSPKQLGEVLFEKMKISDNPKKTKTRQYKTDEESLQALADKHPIVGRILEYRGIKKLLSTYIEALPQLINPGTERIHTSFNQAVTATGRLSSTNPNLQNIPVRDKSGRQIRKAFVPPGKDWVLMSADYSQVELRIMAHLSGDKNLKQAFLDGEDIHTATAAKIYGVASGEVTREQRRRAKTANFGIIYGISAFGLSQRLGIPRKEAKELIDGYFALYPGVKQYMDDTVAKAREQGYIETIFKRRRYLNDIRSANAVARGLAERNAINAPIQGSAADIMKIAMIAVHRELGKDKFRSRTILQVHDELVLEVPHDEVTAVRELVADKMSHAASLTVSLVVDTGTGDNWLDAH